MEYTHPKEYKGVKRSSERMQNIIRNRVEEYCLKCDKFMGQGHDFSECRTFDKWENGKVIEKQTCPFSHVEVSLIQPIVKFKIENE